MNGPTKESLRMSPAQRIAKQLPIFLRVYGDVKPALAYKTPLDLLVATILSAQCTDARVNIVTKEVFKKYRTANDYARASPAVFEQQIRSTGFYRNKARNIIRMAQMLVKEHGGTVPDRMEALLELPGVARKTANCVLNTIFHKSEGIVVDTHVLRLSSRMGWSDLKNPVKLEQELMRVVPRKNWMRFGNMVQAHGRAVCTAHSPKCFVCPFNKVCPSAFVAH